MTPECRKSSEVHTSYEYREGKTGIKKEGKEEERRKKDRMRHFPKKNYSRKKVSEHQMLQLVSNLTPSVSECLRLRST